MIRHIMHLAYQQGTPNWAKSTAQVDYLATTRTQARMSDGRPRATQPTSESLSSALPDAACIVASGDPPMSDLFNYSF